MFFAMNALLNGRDRIFRFIAGATREKTRVRVYMDGQERTEDRKKVAWCLFRVHRNVATWNDRNSRQRPR